MESSIYDRMQKIIWKGRTDILGKYYLKRCPFWSCTLKNTSGFRPTGGVLKAHY